MPAEREPSADMRLLERERERAGAEAPKRSQWRTLDLDDLPDLPLPDVRTPRGALVAWSLTAYPDRDLVPGAIVTISLAITNEGTADVRGVRVQLAPPAGLTFRGGTFEIDRRAAEDSLADALLGSGIVIDALAPRERRTYLARFTLAAGGDDIAVVPDVRAAGAAVIGTHALRLRRSPAASAFAMQLQSERRDEARAPFYELDDDEALVYEAADAALGGVDPTEPSIYTTDDEVDLDREPLPDTDVPPLEPATPAEPAAAQAAIPEPAIAEAVVDDAAARESPVAPSASDAAPLEPQSAPPLSGLEATQTHEAAAAVPPAAPPAPAMPTFAALGGPVLTVSLDASRLLALGRLFTGERSLGMIAHYLLLNALAAVEPLDAGDGYDGALAAFAAEEERLLSRALIAIKLKREVAPNAVAAPLPPFPPAAASFDGPVPIERIARDGRLVLYRPFRETEITFLKRTIENEGTAAFMRAAQLFVGSCATGLAVAASAERRACERELGEYATAATSEINRLFVRARLTRRSELFTPTASDFDARARRLVAALAPFAAA